MAVLTAHSNENKIPVRQSSIFQEAKENVPRTLSWCCVRVAALSVCVFVYLAECCEFTSRRKARSFVKNRPL